MPSRARLLATGLVLGAALPIVVLGARFQYRYTWRQSWLIWQQGVSACFCLAFRRGA